MLALGGAACSGSDEPPLPCGGPDTASLQAALLPLSPACRIDLSHSPRCTSPEFKECNGFCRGNEVLFCGKPADECSGIFNDQPIDDLLRRSSSVRIEHPFADEQGFTSFELDTDADAMALESLVRGYGCDKQCLTEVVFRRNRVVATWPKWNASDPEPACFGEARALLEKWAGQAGR